MRQKHDLLTIISFTAVVLAACDNDAERIKLCLCEENQVCSQSGVCYDNAACAACTGDTVCVGGKCYAPSDPCAVCDAAQVCFKETCYEDYEPCAQCRDDQVCKFNRCLNSDDPCAQCAPGEVCRHHQCLKSSDPCAKCDEDQVCHRETCYAANDPCAQCDDAEICNKGACFAEDDPCAQCGDDEICYLGECADVSTTCVPACLGTDVCVNGSCQPCLESCGDGCCEEGFACDPVMNSCQPECADGTASCDGYCCMDGQACDPEFGACAAVCEDPAMRCDNSQYGFSMCCVTGQVCEDGLCKEDCKGGVRCNEICCAVGDVCEENTCKIACDANTHSRCGENEEFCCDNATELCLYGSCLPRGKTCETSNNCSFEEFCDESTKTCVLIENVPATCTVHPATGPFTPMLQWHWPENLPNGKPTVHPDFVQVMSTPSVMNLTDDNGDGKINEDDIPDVIFTAFKNSAYTTDCALHVISGDTGQEIATYHTTEFRYDHAPGVAKVNHDEYPEIVVRTASGSMILNVVPKTDASGYELKKVGHVSGYSARFANLDGSEYPQLLTSGGMYTYSEDEAGNPVWTQKCSVNFGNWSGYTVADLDGDGISEIVGNNIYDKDCKKISTDTISGNPALADVDLSDDTANGRLAVEQIMMVSGGQGPNGTTLPPPGTVSVYKIFKNEEGKFYRERVWIKDMPFNYDKANQMLKNYNYKATDGSVAQCHNKIADVANNNAASSTNEYKEWRRRYTCQTGGGPLVVADFNGDKKPDIGLVTASSYVVFDAHGDVLWADFTTTDFSSKATGSTLFDFEGDGVSEILYADEVEFHVYKGPGSGVVDEEYGYCSAELLITPIPNSSGTLMEYPIVVDVDNDGSSEIVISANDYGRSGVGRQHGVRAYEDPTGHWVRTRRVWNQFDYHVTNINEDGTVPKSEQQNWNVKSLNNFRQNVQPGGLFNAPNLMADAVTSDISTCTAENRIVKLIATVSNKGSLGIRAGLNVHFYADNVNGTSQSAFLGTAKVTDIMTPGRTSTATLLWDHYGQVDGSEDRVLIETPVDIRIVADPPTEGKDRGEFIECIEDDNTLAASQIKGCPAQIN